MTGKNTEAQRAKDLSLLSHGALNHKGVLMGGEENGKAYQAGM